MPIGQEEQVILIIPGDLIDFKFKLFLCLDTMGPSIYESHQIFLVSNSNSLAIWTPTDINILT